MFTINIFKAANQVTNQAAVHSQDISYCISLSKPIQKTSIAVSAGKISVHFNPKNEKDRKDDKRSSSPSRLDLNCSRENRIQSLLTL